MSSPSRLVMRALAAADAAVLAAALVTVGAHPASASHRAAVAASQPGPSTTITAPPAANGARPVPPAPLPPLPTTARPATPTAGTAPTTDVPSIVSNAGAATDPGPVSPTPPGTYVYTASEQSGRGSSSTTLDEQVLTESDVSGELRQSVTDTSSDGLLNARQ